MLTRILGREAVIGGVGQIGVVIASPGVIRHTGTMAKLTFGELDNTRYRARRGVAGRLHRGRRSTPRSPTDINLAIWQKFAFLVPMSACTASMRSTIGPIRANPQTRAFLLDVMREVGRGRPRTRRQVWRRISPSSGWRSSKRCRRR